MHAVRGVGGACPKPTNTGEGTRPLHATSIGCGGLIRLRNITSSRNVVYSQDVGWPTVSFVAVVMVTPVSGSRALSK